MIDLLRFIRPGKKIRRAVYKCMFGYSEKFIDDDYVDESGIDYICFTDDDSLAPKNWNTVFIDSKNLGPVRTSKMVKILFFQFLKGYDISLYIVNNIKLKCKPSQIFTVARRRSMVCFRHPWWDCIYTESEKLIEMEYDDRQTLEGQATAYRKSGFPAHHGLIAGTMLLRDHRDKQLRKVMVDWFDEVKKHSYRDQMSFIYVAWKNKFQVGHFDGSLVENQLMDWPIVDGPRVPRGFRDDVYLALNPDVAETGLNPRKHYLLFGAAEGRAWKA